MNLTVDHVVVAGSRVVPIFSRYVDGTRAHWSDGYLFAGSHTINPDLANPVLQEVAQMAGASTVMGIVSLSSPDGQVWVDNTEAPDGVYAGGTDWSVHAIRAFLLEAADTHRVNLAAVSQISDCVI